MVSNPSKKILITSGRSPVALDLARQFHHAGHQVYAADTMNMHVCRFSNAVAKSFTIRSPRRDFEGFVSDLSNILEKEKIDLLVPIYEEALYISQAQSQLPKSCQVFVSPFPLLLELHNKWLFNQKIKKLGFEAPESMLLHDKEDLKKLDSSKTYVLKACYSRAGLQIKKLLPPHHPIDFNIEPHNPWIAQEWLEGDKFCTYSVCHAGKVLAHAVYPVGYTVDGKGCVIFEAVDHLPILEWIKKFVKETNFTGQIAFDFIELPGHRLFAIECNPRATSGAHLFSREDRLDRAFFKNVSAPILPKKGYCKQLAIAMLIYGWKKNACPDNSFKRFIQTLFKVKDVIIDVKDPLPICLEPIVFLCIWWNSLKLGLSLPAFFLHDYEWNGEVNEIGVELEENQRQKKSSSVLCTTLKTTD